MRSITRIHLSDCGWHEAYYPGTTIELTDPRTGEPKHTVFSLENTGGKTSFLALVLSCFDTNERRFLKTLIHSNQRFADYFAEVPAFILVEWDLSAGKTNLLEPQRLVTGQVVVPRSDGRRREMERRFFTFRSGPGLALDDVPAPGLPGFDPRTRLNGHKEVMSWLHTMRLSHPGNFQVFGNQSDWKRKLAEEKIDTELIAAQVEFNRSEGGIEDFLNFRTEEQFVRKFFALTVPEAEAESVRSVVAEHVARLADLPLLERRREAMRGLKDRFAPFLKIARAAHTAEETLTEQVSHAMWLRKGLEERRARAAYGAESKREKAERHEKVAKASEVACTGARIKLASAAVETARRRCEVADAKARAREAEENRAREQLKLLRAAASMREIVDDRARARALQEAIDAGNADLKPRRDGLRRVGERLAATLRDRAGELRKRQRVCTKASEELAGAAREADEKRRIALEQATCARRKVNRIDVNLEHASVLRTRLEGEGVLDTGEIADLAEKRYAKAANEAREEAADLREAAEEDDRAARQQRQHESELKQERSGLEREIASLQQIIHEGEAKRRELAFDPTLLKLAGECEIDPDAEAIERLLGGERNRACQRHRQEERRLEVTENAQESLSATGLAAIDKDVRTVVDLLREGGLHDAQPHAVYTSRIMQSAKEVRIFAELDPAAFAGVAVANRNALEAARRILDPPPPISRHVVVAVASTAPKNVPRDRFVLAVDESAAYDPEAASELARGIETDLDRLSKSIQSHQQHISQIEEKLREIRVWKERFGAGHHEQMHRERNRHEDQIGDIELHIGRLAETIEATDRKARTARGSAREHDEEAHVRAELARRASEYHEQWGSHIEKWRLERLDLEHSAQLEEDRARRCGREHERFSRESSSHEDQAEQSARDASTLEGEAAELAYAGEAGEAANDLMALREEYATGLETLRNLEEERVEHLRGQLEEIERALSKKEHEYQRTFADLHRAGVETEAKREDIRDVADEAAETLEAARETAAIAQAEAQAAHGEHRLETKRRTEEIKPETVLDLTALTPEELSEVPPCADKTLIIQEGIRAEETRAAALARRLAASNTNMAARCADWSTMLNRVLNLEGASTRQGEIPEDEEILVQLVNETVSALVQANEALRGAHADVHRRYEGVRRFARSPAISALETEREVSAHLGENDALDAAAQAPRMAVLIDERLKSIEHDLAHLDEDRDACVAELERLLSTALHIVRRMLRDGRIPDHVPRFGGEPVFKMNADLSRVPVVQRREILRNYVSDLAEANRVPETGQDIAAALVDRMRTALGKTSLGIRLLKPKGEGDTEHMPIDRVTVSGGELLTAAMMIYVVLARLRTESMPGSTGEAGVLILDNPLGKANKALLLRTQIGLADAMGIQLFYTSGIQDLGALAEFENIVRLRRNRQSRATGRIHVELETVRVHIDRKAKAADPPAVASS